MARYKITGRKYGMEKCYYNWDKEKKYYFYNLVEEKEFDAMEFSDMNAARKWLLENCPEYYFGCTIRGIDTDEFCAIAGPEIFDKLY